MFWLKRENTVTLGYYVVTLGYCVVTLGYYVVQVELFRQDRKEEIKRNLPMIIEGRKAKKRKLLEERQKKGETVDESEYEEEIEFDVESVPVPAIRPDQTLVQMHLGILGIFYF